MHSSLHMHCTILPGFGITFIMLLYYTVILPSSEPLDAPNITSVLAQDSALTVVFSDKAVCRNSSWEVCVAVDSQDQTEHCSHQSAEDRLITVEAGNGKSGRARVLFGDRISQYSETFLIPTSVLPKGTVTAHHNCCFIQCKSLKVV